MTSVTFQALNFYLVRNVVTAEAMRHEMLDLIADGSMNTHRLTQDAKAVARELTETRGSFLSAITPYDGEDAHLIDQEARGVNSMVEQALGVSPRLAQVFVDTALELVRELQSRRRG